MTQGTGRVLVGKQIGAYQVTSLLGAGGMGEVYRAEDTRLGRPVAVKVLPEELAQHNDRLHRFVREARAASALNHPNVAHIYEIGQSDGLHFIAMEYVEGQSLAQKLSGRPLELWEVLDIGIQAADALEEAHRKGITHRDIKSANLMITAKGQVKVLDFGLAKITRSEDEGVGSDASTSIHTAQGVVMGTLRYMSPEQVLGKELDSRTDLFSLGVVLYEMTTGRLPFSGNNASEVTDRILHAQPEALARFNYEVPAELERVIRKSLEKDQERRYQSAQDLLIDLKNLKRESDSGKAAVDLPTRERSQERLTLRYPRVGSALAAALALVAVVAGTWLWLRSQNPTLPSHSDYVQLTNLPDSATQPALSPDGRMLTFIRGSGTFTTLGQIYVKMLPSGEPRQLTRDNLRKMSPVFSPDGSRIAYTVVDKGNAWDTWEVPVLGGEPRRWLPTLQAWSGLIRTVFCFPSLGEGASTRPSSPRPEAVPRPAMSMCQPRRAAWRTDPISRPTANRSWW